jgi:hypothetical protein
VHATAKRAGLVGTGEIPWRVHVRWRAGAVSAVVVFVSEVICGRAVVMRLGTYCMPGTRKKR